MLQKMSQTLYFINYFACSDLLKNSKRFLLFFLKRNIYKIIQQNIICKWKIFYEYF